MKNVRRLAFVVALAASTVAIGCSGTASEQQQPQTSASALTKAPVGANTHGQVRLVGEALGEVPLRADQRVELEKLSADAEARHVAGAEAHKDFMLGLADQIEKGAIDRAALQAKIDAAVAARTKSVADDQASLARLHDILTPDQRSAFVDAFEAKMKAKHGEHGPREGFAKMKQLKEDLKLTDDQISQIKDVIKEAKGNRALHAMGKDFHHEMESRKEALESFRTEKFDATALVKPVDPQKASAFADHATGIAEKVLPILTAEQRKLAADKIRDMAQKGEMGPFGR